MAFAADLKSATAQAHDQAEHSTFMEELLAGHLDVQAFIRLQEQSWLFYQALEQATDAVRATGFAAGLLDPRLNRTKKLAADLQALKGDGWAEGIRPLPAIKEYVARLEQIRDEADGPRLIAHHYVRYLGDLSGGQVIATMMRRHYDLEDQHLSFYAFPEIDKLKVYKDAYRSQLDELALSEQDYQRALDEACDAFAFNFNLFNDLGSMLNPA